MTTLTAPRRSRTIAAPTIVEPARASRTLGSLVRDAADLVAAIALDDPRWAHLGPELTAFVDAAGRGAGGTGSPIRKDEVVPPVLRLRDVARLAQATAATVTNATTETEDRLRSLQAAALR